MLFSLIVANLKIIFRDRQALFWALFFPLIFVVVFGLFKLDEPSKTTIAVVDQAQDPVSKTLIANLGSIELMSIEQDKSEREARDALKAGKINFVLIIPRDWQKRLGRDLPVPYPLPYSMTSHVSNRTRLSSG